jgi:hypothetical protein
MAPPTAETSLPTQVRNRIARLEATVVELTGALDTVVREVQRAGVLLKLPKRPLGYAVLKKLGAKRLRELAGEIEVSEEGAAPLTVELRSGTGGLVGAERRGEAARLAWVVEGEVVPAAELADAWGLTPQALGPAGKRGELFAVVVKRQRYYPREFLELDRDDVATVCKLLVPLDPVEKLLFWKRPHGALGGKTVVQVLGAKKNGPQLARVAQLARAHSAQAAADAAAAA